jgi:hypothetical protein
VKQKATGLLNRRQSATVAHTTQLKDKNQSLFALKDGGLTVPHNQYYIFPPGQTIKIPILCASKTTKLPGGNPHLSCKPTDAS